MQAFRPRWVSRTGLSLFPGLNHLRPYPYKQQQPWISTRNNSSIVSPEKGFDARVQEIKESTSNPYPRLLPDTRTLSCAAFRSRYASLENDQTVEHPVVVHGRIRTYRLAGSKLIFFDLVQDGHKIQVMCNQRRLDEVSPGEFKKFYRLLRRGDAFSVTGKPHRTTRGELTILAADLPTLLSPCLHDVPVDTKKHEHSPYPRHVQFLADQHMADIIRARAAVTQYLRQFFLDRAFMEINTPIIGSVAGGAIARPFATSAVEFPERPLSLRIAPELWLKRMVIGGFDRVFEIGPSFRNEGLDKTHNPEFTTCEFYHAYANLEDLMSVTESLLSGMASHIHQFNENDTLNPTTADFSHPFHRIDFITGIEEKIGRSLPDLTTTDALTQLKQLFNDLSLTLPDNPTLPRLLDQLSSLYLEPQCINPTFITNPPECLSPLSKSFTHPTNHQRVAARAELFIEGREVVNTYEEENSPFEQRQKFETQARESKMEGEGDEIDESYLQALEWGLPPTGGWGCGIDRLCMLFTGTKRIGEVLPFGSLRMVTRRHDRRDV